MPLPPFAPFLRVSILLSDCASWFDNKLVQLFRLNPDVLLPGGFLLPVLLHPSFPAFSCGRIAITSNAMSRMMMISVMSATLL